MATKSKKPLPKFHLGDRVRVDATMKEGDVTDADLLTGRFRYRVGKSKTWREEDDLTLIRSAKPFASPSAIRPARKPRIRDFDDEDDVRKEIAKALDRDADGLVLKRSSAPNGCGDAWAVESRWKAESPMWFVMRNFDEFEAAAIEGVKNDLQQYPESFSRDFIESHIDTNKLRDELMSDVANSNMESLQDDARRDPIRFMSDHDIEIPAPTGKQVEDWAAAEEKTVDDVEEFLKQDPEDQWLDIGDEPEVPFSDIEEAAEALARQQLQDPMDYLRDIYGPEDVVKEAIRIAGIDEDAAAQEAVSTDGPEHFMCGYDGNYDTTPSGFILWRH